MASKHSPDVLVSGAGWLMQFGCRLSEALRAVGYTNDDIHRLATEQGKDEVERGVRAFVEALAGELVNPHEYFANRPGLWVSDWFTERILAVAKPAKAPSVKLGRYDLPRNMNDAEIRAELGDGHIFENVSEFCAMFAGMLDAQSSGEDGELLNNGYANIFYVRGVNGGVFAVCAYWYSGRRRWLVYAYRLVDRRWRAGCRVFSATADARAA